MGAMHVVSTRRSNMECRSDYQKNSLIELQSFIEDSGMFFECNPKNSFHLGLISGILQCNKNDFFIENIVSHS